MYSYFLFLFLFLLVFPPVVLRDVRGSTLESVIGLWE